MRITELVKVMDSLVNREERFSRRWEINFF